MTKLTSTAMASLALLAGMAAHAQGGVKTYIVQLKDEPAASYQGTTTGYAATQAAPGKASERAAIRQGQSRMVAHLQKRARDPQTPRQIRLTRT